MNRPRVAFAGCGWIGLNRLKAVHDDGTAEIVAIADTDDQARQRASQVVPRAAKFSSYEELFEVEPDGVIIATPSALHARQCLSAFGQGASVFCQKPLARTAEETSVIVEAARASDLLLAVDFSYRHTEALRAVRRVVQSGQIGHVYAGELVFHNAYGPDKPWFHDPLLAGGGCVIDLGVHLVDAAFWVLDFPRVIGMSSRLFAQGQPIRQSSLEVEDYATAQMTLEGDVTLGLSCSWRLPIGCDALIGARFYGTEGGVTLRNVNGSFYDFTAEYHRGTENVVLTSPPDDWGGRGIVEWVHQLADEGRYMEDADRLVDVAEAIDDFYGRNRRSTRVPFRVNAGERPNTAPPISETA